MPESGQNVQTRGRVCTKSDRTEIAAVAATGIEAAGIEGGGGTGRQGWRSKCTGVLATIGITSAKWQATR